MCEIFIDTFATMEFDFFNEVLYVYNVSLNLGTKNHNEFPCLQFFLFDNTLYAVSNEMHMQVFIHYQNIPFFI